MTNVFHFGECCSTGVVHYSKVDWPWCYYSTRSQLWRPASSVTAVWLLCRGCRAVMCNVVDPSGNRYNADSLASCVSVAVNNKYTDMTAPRENAGAGDLSVIIRQKLHCICHSPSKCYDYRYHTEYVYITDVPDESWLGLCCLNSSTTIHRRREELHLKEQSLFRKQLS